MKHVNGCNLHFQIIRAGRRQFVVYLVRRLHRLRIPSPSGPGGRSLCGAATILPVILAFLLISVTVFGLRN